jgi:hypothetical protein
MNRAYEWSIPDAQGALLEESETPPLRGAIGLVGQSAVSIERCQNEVGMVHRLL